MRRWCMREERGNMRQEVETQEETKTMMIKGKAEEMNEARGGIQGRNKEVRVMRKNGCVGQDGMGERGGGALRIGTRVKRAGPFDR